MQRSGGLSTRRRRGGVARSVVERATPRTVVLWSVGACAALALIGFAWVVITGLLAQSQLNSVKRELPELRKALVAGDFPRAQALADKLSGHAHRAHDLTTGPAWWVSASLPGVGTPLDTVRTIATASDEVGRAVLPGVLKLAGDLTGSSLRHGDTINLAAVSTAEPVLVRASASAADAANTVRATSSSSWLPGVGGARESVVSGLDDLHGELAGATRAVQIALPMLGQTGAKRYFVAFQNEAESRGLGGLPGAFAVVTTDHGKITFDHFGNDTALSKVSTGLNLGADFNARYGRDNPAGEYRNSNISPHFPYAAQIWAAMWEKSSGQHVDGALAVDPTALAYLLKVTGPAMLPDGSAVTADNVVAITERDQYSRFSDDTKRKDYVVAVSKAASTKLLSGTETTKLLRAASKAAHERRIVVWSSDPAVEQNLIAAGYAGDVSAGHGPVSGFTVVNAAGAKLDYYLDRAMSYQRTGCGTGSTAVATLKLTNGAPRSGLPVYVTTRADHAPPGTKPGDNRVLVTYYATQGALVGKVTLDGKPITVASLPENGLVTVTLDVELPVGTSRTMTVTVEEPPATQAVQILRQPLVRPLSVTVGGWRCGP
ncbi:MAG: hypothetical protein JWO57_4489 [Pseudonocardiales bacterium]|nr:hypothetical protein [Pseudonocardiales bacterium]